MAITPRIGPPGLRSPVGAPGRVPPRMGAAPPYMSPHLGGGPPDLPMAGSMSPGGIAPAQGRRGAAVAEGRAPTARPPAAPVGLPDIAARIYGR